MTSNLTIDETLRDTLRDYEDEMDFIGFSQSETSLMSYRSDIWVMISIFFVLMSSFFELDNYFIFGGIIFSISIIICNHFLSDPYRDIVVFYSSLLLTIVTSFLTGGLYSPSVALILLFPLLEVSNRFIFNITLVYIVLFIHMVMSYYGFVIESLFKSNTSRNHYGLISMICMSVCLFYHKYYREKTIQKMLKTKANQRAIMVKYIKALRNAFTQINHS
jgi:hypothetical protein